jgi:cholesterol transport system auxiliary component
MSKRRTNFRRSFGVILAMLVSACATDPLPDYRYYRPHALLTPTALPLPALTSVLEVEAFRADGVFGERPIVYSFAEEPQKLSQYHYQLWTDPPGAILQRRFVDVLAAIKVAPLVTARASPRAEPTKLTGIIERLERVRIAPGTWQIAVKLRIRIESHRGDKPLLERTYERSLDVADDTISASVERFGQALDGIAEAVAHDLLALKNNPAPMKKTLFSSGGSRQ